MKRLAAILSMAMLAATATPVLAHTGHDDHGGLMHGFLHPIGGLDHVLAMVAVGVLAFQLGGRALWLVPLSFVTMMAFGGVLGFLGSGLPHVELGIALSVLVLGALLAMQFKLPTALTAGIVGLFAIFHGYAHGAELPGGASPVAFAFGFVAATAILHAVGLGLGRFLALFPGIVPRLSGAAMMAAGVGLLAG